MKDYSITPTQKKFGKVVIKLVEWIFMFIIMTFVVFGLIHLAAHIFLPVIIYLLTQFGLVEICGFLSCLFSSETSSLVAVYIISILLIIVGSCLQ